MKWPRVAVGDFVVRLRTDDDEPVIPPDTGVVAEVRSDDALAVRWASGAAEVVRIERLRIARIWPIDDAVDQLPRDDLDARHRWALEQWREMIRHIEED